MKTKTQTKQRNQLRQIDVINKDLKSEFEDVIDDFSVIDEVAYAELLENEDC